MSLETQIKVDCCVFKKDNNNSHSVWKSPKMSHFDFFKFWDFSPFLLLLNSNFKFLNTLQIDHFWHFPPIFVLLIVNCLVTLFDNKLQVFKNSPKWTNFGIFSEVLSTQNVNLGSLRLQCWMRLFMGFSNTVSNIIGFGVFQQFSR